MKEELPRYTLKICQTLFGQLRLKQKKVKYIFVDH